MHDTALSSPQDAAWLTIGDHAHVEAGVEVAALRSTDHSHEPTVPTALATTGGGAGMRAGASVAEPGAGEGMPAV